MDIIGQSWRDWNGLQCTGKQNQSLPYNKALFGKIASVADPGNRKGGFQTIEREAHKFGVMPTSGAVKLGKIPRGSPILDCVELLRTVN